MMAACAMCGLAVASSALNSTLVATPVGVPQTRSGASLFDTPQHWNALLQQPDQAPMPHSRKRCGEPQPLPPAAWWAMCFVHRRIVLVGVANGDHLAEAWNGSELDMI